MAAVIFLMVRRRQRDAKMGADAGAAVGRTWSRPACWSPSCSSPLLFASGRPGTRFPIPGLILAVLVLIYGFITSNTVVGRHIYAVGGNSHAAELSGVAASGSTSWS